MCLRKGSQGTLASTALSRTESNRAVSLFEVLGNQEKANEKLFRILE